MRLGFALCGITNADPPPHHREYAQWLAEGRAGEMLYLGRQEPKRGDLSLVLPGVRSVICVALNYSPETAPPPLPPLTGGEPDFLSRLAASAPFPPREGTAAKRQG